MTEPTKPKTQIVTLPDALEQLGYGDTFRPELCEMLEKIQLFSQSSRKDIEVLSGYVHAYRAPSGTVIVKEGERERLMWFVVEGRLDVYKAKDEEHQKKLATIRAGKTIGEMAMIDELPHSATVVTATDATLLLLTKDNFSRLAAEKPRLGLNITWKIAQLLSHRLRQTSGILVDYL